MPHPLIDQLRFTRSEFRRALEGITDEEAHCRFMPMNSLSWIVAHLASQEQFYWLYGAQGTIVVPGLYEVAGHGQPASTPPLDDAWEAWFTVTQASDPYLDTLTTDKLMTHITVDGKPLGESIGSSLRRVTYHYWYHLGESQAIRQMLGHKNLSEFVGALGAEAPYRPE